MDFTTFLVTCGTTWGQFLDVVNYLGFWFFTILGFALGFVTAITWVILCCHWDEKRGKDDSVSNRDGARYIVGKWIPDGDGQWTYEP
jgi:hypothetical protein